MSKWIVDADIKKFLGVLICAVLVLGGVIYEQNETTMEKDIASISLVVSEIQANQNTQGVRLLDKMLAIEKGLLSKNESFSTRVRSIENQTIRLEGRVDTTADTVGTLWELGSELGAMAREVKSRLVILEKKTEGMTWQRVQKIK